jgi:cytochrome c oxidase subunit 3
MSQGYYVPAPSKWPMIGATALLFMAFGVVGSVNRLTVGHWVLIAGLTILAYLIYGWFREVSHESEAGKYKIKEDKSFRWSMAWFIFSEVMFFASFFGALYYMRVLSIPWLAGPGQELLWPDFAGGWPTAGPGFEENFTPMGAWGIPAINTTLLLLSGVTITFAHWALKKNDRGALKLWLFATIVLGITFIGFQLYEYGHAYSEMNLKMTSGAYGSIFYILTGFHGFHVSVGTIMLISIFFRVLNGHFTPDQHFGFEGVAWYWHFVDVVWLILFIFVYLV